MALEEAGMLPEEVGYVNAHGTSTPLNDLAETKALRRVFGDAVPPTSSVKSMVGHLIGAAGAVEAAVTAMAISREILTPTINYAKPDPEIDIDVVPNEAREAKGIEAAISNSFGFGGQNAVLAFRRV
jgi:3-oxoacyl-[acyl-carrier-protein] synthase II